jgi:hypothetical protein
MYQRSTSLVLVGLTSMFAGCLDASPVSIAPPSTLDAGLVIEAGPVADGAIPIDAYAHPECRACIAADPIPGPGCGDRLDTCINGSAHCIDIYECAYSLGCVTKMSQSESISCAIPCAAALKITDVNDPSIQLAIRLTECFHSACKEACEVGDTAARQ